MKFFRTAILVLFILSITSCNYTNKKKEAAGNKITRPDIVGKWVRNGPGPKSGLHFKNDGTVEGDIHRDGQIEVASEYTIDGENIILKDIEGQTCPGKGVYRVVLGKHYVAFDFVEDSCFGRTRATMGFWTRTNHAEILTHLDSALNRETKPELLLERARMNMALGNVEDAQKDFDAYLKIDSTDAWVFMNRAGTKFPHDLHGVIKDCNKAISLDPKDGNSYYMRGIARYQTGQRAEACEDFSRAIELGFSFLKKTESGRCAQFW